MAGTESISFPIVVSGPSGVGKTTLCHGLMERDRKLAFSISATTRPARTTEKHGKDYFFISREEFERKKAEKPRTARGVSVSSMARERAGG